ncbi:hypothetical protein BURMUCF2_A1952 [Burkholderia multivorans CF2]|nr:hypothetical protein BURMUCF2_A1952 [Burkholderia multivorans CF2]
MRKKAAYRDCRTVRRPFFRTANSPPRCHARFVCIALNPVNAMHGAITHAIRAHGTRVLRLPGIH